MPEPSLVSEPVSEISAARVSVSVKLATIWPLLTMKGVTIAPESPPLPRLSVLPVKMLTPVGELTTAPSATVSVPTSVPLPQPQPGSPMVSPPWRFNTEPRPVTDTAELPSTESPMITSPFTFTAPPLAIVSRPGPLPTPPSPTIRPEKKPPPTFQVEPGPVTVTLGVPGRKELISAPPWLFSTPPLLIDRVAGAEKPTLVGPPVTVTLEPGPEMTMLLPTSRPAGDDDDPICSVPPLTTASVPPSTTTPPPKPPPRTVNAPPLIVSPPVSQLHKVRLPPMAPMLPPLLAPVSVSAVPLSSSSEPAPANDPENVVLAPPETASRVEASVGPTMTVPPPESEPISTVAASPAPALRLR